MTSMIDRPDDKPRQIGELQNTAQSITLLRAAAVAHRHAQRTQVLSLACSILIALLSVVAAAVPRAAAPVTAIGALWALAYALVLAPRSGRDLRASATLQEMFDVALFGLPWNAVAVGDPLSEDQILDLSRRYRGDDSRLRDYYLVADAPAPYPVLFCQKQNLEWGARIRQRFANTLIVLVLLWCAIGALVGLASSLSLGSLVTVWYVPSLGLLLLCLDIYRAQVGITEERTRVLELLRGYFRAGAPTSDGSHRADTFIREVQDALFHLRKQQPRVPDWLFKRFRDRDLARFQAAMGRLEDTLGQRHREAT